MHLFLKDRGGCLSVLFRRKESKLGRARAVEFARSDSLTENEGEEGLKCREGP